MDQFKDSIDASMQKLKTVLSQDGMADFKSALPAGKGKELSEEIVNTIVYEIENFLIHIANCKLDQISGRIEEKLASYGAAGFSISDEQIEKITKAISESEEFQKLNDSFKQLQQSRETAGDRQQPSSEPAEAASDENTEGNGEDKSDGDESDMAPVDKIISVLNNINKDKRLKDFKEYLTELGDSSTGFSLFGDKLTAKTLDKILPKVKFFEIYFEKIYSAILTATDSTFALGKRLANLTKSFIFIGRKMVKESSTAIAANVALAASAAALAVSNITLKTALIAEASSNIALAASNIALAVSNVGLALSNISLALSTLISLVTITITVITAIISIFSVVIAATVSVVAAVAVAAASVLASTVSMSISVAASVLALAISSAAVILALALAVVAVTAIALVAIAAMAISMIAAITAVAVVIAASIMAISAVLSAGIGVIGAAIMILAAAIFVMLAFFTSAVFAFSSAVLIATAVVSYGIAVLTAFATAGIIAMIGAGAVIVAGIAAAAVAFAGVALTTAVTAVIATLAGITLGLLLIFLFLYLCIMEGIERLIAWFKDLTIYKWWTEEVEPAGGLWEYIKAKFHEQFGWFEKLKDENGGWLGAIWKVVLDWWTGDSDGGGIWDWIWEKMKGAWEWAADLTGWLWEKIKAGLETIFGWMCDIGATIKNVMVNWWLQSDFRKLIKKIADFIGVDMADPPPADWPKPAQLESVVPPSPPPLNDVIRENLVYVKQVRAATDLNWLKDQLNIWSSSDAMEKAAGDETIKKIFQSKIDALKQRIQKLQKENGQKEEDISVQVGAQTGQSIENIETGQAQTEKEIDAAASEIRKETDDENRKRDAQVAQRAQAVKGVEQRVADDKKQQEKQQIPFAVPYDAGNSLGSENR